MSGLAAIWCCQLFALCSFNTKCLLLNKTLADFTLNKPMKCACMWDCLWICVWAAEIWLLHMTLTFRNAMLRGHPRASWLKRSFSMWRYTRCHTNRNYQLGAQWYSSRQSCVVSNLQEVKHWPLTQRKARQSPSSKSSPFSFVLFYDILRIQFSFLSLMYGLNNLEICSPQSDVKITFCPQETSVTLASITRKRSSWLWRME